MPFLEGHPLYMARSRGVQISVVWQGGPPMNIVPMPIASLDRGIVSKKRAMKRCGLSVLSLHLSVERSSI